SLGPHHSFPLEEVIRYVSSRGVEETLRQAILDSPLFLSRWRWNLNRALLVLRFRNGRKNPPPIQRMEADDFMAALFPQAAACQENITGPIEIPDHLIVRQTIADTLHEALDIDGVRALLGRVEAGDVAVHCCDTTEPSVLAHEIVTANPYAFLDNEELPNRRTNAVSLRRGLHVDLSSIGALDADAAGAGLRLRARVRGDRFQPLGLKEPVRLQDVLVNAKVPRGERDDLPLVVSDRGIAWVPGVRVAQWAVVTAATRRVVEVSIERGAQG
ncbi:MAG: tRNA lysidine(34) synthetase TilS, partial [Chloroflexi bacterium]|nr:tRNA lysidine(34) synthetase TilS [Chloroflexota bacterium]